MNLNHVFFKTKNSLNSELSHLWFVLRRSGSWSDLLFSDFWWNIWFWQCDFLLTQCLYKYSCFSLDSVRVGTFVMSACGFRVMTHWPLSFFWHWSVQENSNLFLQQKKTQELPCGLLLKLTITPQYAITVITHSCPINNTAVIFYWIVWGCWKCKGDLGLKLEVGSWVGTGNFYLASQLRENLCSTHKHWTFPSFLMHTRLHHVMHAAEHKCSFILIHELPFQTPDWVLRSRFDFLLKGLLCLTMFAY